MYQQVFTNCCTTRAVYPGQIFMTYLSSCFFRWPHGATLCMLWELLCTTVYFPHNYPLVAYANSLCAAYNRSSEDCDGYECDECGNCIIPCNATHNPCMNILGINPIRGTMEICSGPGEVTCIHNYS